MALVLAASAVFVYVRLRAELDDAIGDKLRARVAAGVRSDAPPPLAEEADESFGQLLDARGRVLATAGAAREPALRPDEAARAARGPIVVERNVAGIEDTARILARPADVDGVPVPLPRPGGEPIGPPRVPAVVVAGESLEDRDETLAGVVRSFAAGGPVAVLLASLFGYLLARTALAPMEAMRRRAAQVSLAAGDDARLPLPAARDEVRRLGETLNAMLDRLGRAFARERQFVADASHELRTPIAVVKAELEAALRHDAAPDARESLVAAVEECDRLAQLAEDLLVLARAGEGALPVQREPLPARAALQDARLRFADRAAQRGRTVRVDAPDGLVLHADPLRVRQALSNLVDNALRHGAGEIVLAARPGVLEVRDEGAGFDPALFERFARGDEARTRGGAGLGLAIVRAIAEAHGGRAEADGAAVRIALPSQRGLSGGA